MKTLIPMTDFVLEQSKGMEESDAIPFCYEVVDYSRFLKQSLEIWMFVPCDYEGNVLEEPKCDCRGKCNDENIHKCVGEHLSYKSYKERVLFEGFEVDLEEGWVFPFLNNYPIAFFDENNKWVISDYFKTIEDLVNHNLTLTPTALKQIGL